MEQIQIAVYGTLKKGHGNHEYLLKDAEYVGSCKTKPNFTMYSLGGYPAVVPEGDTPITVEVYKVDKTTEEAVNQLEGFSGSKESPANWYDRMSVETDFGSAEMYIFHQPPNHNVVKDGNW